MGDERVCPLISKLVYWKASTLNALCGSRSWMQKAQENQIKVMVLREERRWVCLVSVEGKQSDHVSEFKYIGFLLNESGTEV